MRIILITFASFVILKLQPKLDKKTDNQRSRIGKQLSEDFEFRAEFLKFFEIFNFILDHLCLTQLKTIVAASRS